MAVQAWNNQLAFVGANVALICGDAVLTYLRDDVPGLAFAGMWDLPGGGREAEEAPLDCALRELAEEFGLTCDPGRIEWGRAFASVHPPGSLAYFYVGWISAADLAQVRFGNEGQYWRMMPVSEFLRHTKAIAHLQARLAVFLAEGAVPGGRAEALGGDV